MKIGTLTATRRTLHGVAELLMAGPQYRSSGTIKLHVIEHGFATNALPHAEVLDDHLLVGDHSVTLSGMTYALLGSLVGLEPSSLADVYSGGPGIEPDDQLVADHEAAALICDSLWIGQQALLALSPDDQPVLWPEHFDVGITIDAVNYGVSPGDSYEAEPYAYVGPHSPRTGEFWNAPFGAVRLVRDVDGVQGVLDFFRTGQQLGEGQ